LYYTIIIKKVKFASIPGGTTMKRNYLLLLLFALSLSAAAQNKGITFHEGTFAEALAKAKKENKLVFMDAFTVWCGPCKYLSKNVFTNDTVGGFYNQNFICVKMDMEKGEGIDLAKKYAVQSYPTLLYLDSNGEMVHRTCGVSYSAAATQNLINDGKIAMDPAQSLAGFQKKYEGGSNDAAFISTYLKMRYSACMESDQEVKKYLSSVPEKELSSRSNWNIIYLHLKDAESPQFQYLINNRGEFSKLFTKDSVDRKINQVYSASMRNAVNSKDEARYNKLRAEFIKTGDPKAEQVSAEMDLSLYENTNEHEKYAAAAKKYIEKYASKNANRLNSIAWHFYEVIEDKALLKQAAEWSKRSIEIDNSYANNDTYAALQYKLGNKQEALKYANKAIELAKKGNEDYSETESLLKKIEALK
jgi:thiol-disulfide isomerase/thioredoxin